MRKRLITFLLIFTLSIGAFTLLPSLAQIPGNSPERINEVESVPGELLVQFKKDTSEQGRGRAYERINGRALEIVVAAHGKSPKGDLVLVDYVPRPNLPPEAAIAEIQKDPSVEFAEPNLIYQHYATSNDPFYTNGNLWGMYGSVTNPPNQFGSQAGQAWASGYTGSDTVYVGVIDTGVQIGHSELIDNVWTNANDPINNIDDDGNGYVDDINGWDFNGNNNTVYDGNEDAHGTHVAGTIGAKGGNGLGVAGVTWNVKFITAKFLGPNGGTLANAIKAINYITDLKTRQGLNIVATNNSWGGGGYSQALHDAIIRAAKADILFVAAAGNSSNNNDKKANYPSNYDTSKGTRTELAASYNSVIAVASITSTGVLSNFSNYGAKTVHIGGPGSSILSTVPGGYAYYNGTSMAAPHVTGGVALYSAAHPQATASQMRSAILNSAVFTSSLNRKTVTNGRLNVYNALTN
ncbi:S8 family peptidase [Umezakia ovalisporum]|jgi:subtilisin family serine protease|uniref:S8 family serine peptidase n=1 Tax=Umezakia ovalisporum FSS-62 TaxID=2971776 RepID=A0AA43H2S2_9CYAN|nr:S8 family peptidase [Umezakia ovalisporum]MBI1242171.1 S8 family serine peptidase [Nostoc sp. RI_552]MDH6065645.1 S8 family serine peptidase [Umezakia ovalisporum FSS-62]MDH6076886.1 S8 family serine peptidase [Umezakia ovalisporum FSS-45]MDH6086477.1 S8 family serine peptidase [Umezakia ovalisporum TAC611]MDH6087177.1 S8 family serine peptidase [Umezakia ovalisporum Ak1311]